MAPPVTYTEKQLAEYMLRELGEIAGVLGWTAQSQVQDAIDDALLAYPAAVISAATDISRIRALARVMAWRRAVGSLSARYDFSDQAGSYSRSQMLKGARELLGDAEYAASVYLPSPLTVYVDPVPRTGDPYVPLTEGELARLGG